MAFELVGARLLMPLFGMGIHVWTVVIATSLAALAIGYWTGGKIADTRSSVITLAVVLLLAAVSLVFVRFSGRNIPAVFQNMPLVAGACCSAISILVAPLVLLGMVQPILARLLIRTVARTGKVVGGLMAVGTIGGIFGTALTGLILIPLGLIQGPVGSGGRDAGRSGRRAISNSPVVDNSRCNYYRSSQHHSGMDFRVWSTRSGLNARSERG